MQGNNEGQGTARNNELQGKNSSSNSKLDKTSEPDTYTVVKTFAASLRYNHVRMKPL